jgi:hypothetical protein
MAQERLPMRKIREVLRPKAGGFSKRRIAASLGISAPAARIALISMMGWSKWLHIHAGYIGARPCEPNRARPLCCMLTSLTDSLRCPNRQFRRAIAKPLVRMPLCQLLNTWRNELSLRATSLFIPRNQGR